MKKAILVGVFLFGVFFVLISTTTSLAGGKGEIVVIQDFGGGANEHLFSFFRYLNQYLGEWWKEKGREQVVHRWGVFVRLGEAPPLSDNSTIFIVVIGDKEGEAPISTSVVVSKDNVEAEARKVADSISAWILQQERRKI